MTKLTPSQIQRLAEKILNQWKSQNLITLKVDEKVVLQTMKDVIVADLKREEELDKEVYAVMDQMEKTGQEFQRGKMFHLLRQKMAKEKKIIL
ncbi:MAG: DUF507 family protein [Pseudobdellovibrio sp.]